MQSVLLLLGTVLFSYSLNVILLRFSRNFGVQNRQTQNIIRWGSTSKPTTGGISFYITFLVGTILLMSIHPELFSTSNKILALFLSGTLAFLIGLADDAYSTKPLLKFLGQVACAGILIAFGIKINYFNIWALDSMLTILWVVGLMNSVNMLDNMDAVTATISLTIVASTMGMLVYVNGVTDLFFILVAIAGSFLGFLFLNWRPSKIYMGDTGSMFVGLVLAFLGIVYFWNIKASPDNISYIRQGLIPVIVFIVPIMDTTFVSFARISRGKSPFVGGKDHLTHHLTHIGIPEQLVPVTLGLVSVVSGGLGMYAFYLIPEWSSWYSALFLLYPVGLLGIFFFLYKKGERIGKFKDLLAERERRRLERIARRQQVEPSLS
jgi:UDP-GlcNAc:undecaprenyl-phosphate GlcNAc-1-phosphate transferase